MKLLSIISFAKFEIICIFILQLRFVTYNTLILANDMFQSSVCHLTTGIQSSSASPCGYCCDSNLCNAVDPCQVSVLTSTVASMTPTTLTTSTVATISTPTTLSPTLPTTIYVSTTITTPPSSTGMLQSWIQRLVIEQES